MSRLCQRLCRRYWCSPICPPAAEQADQDCLSFATDCCSSAATACSVPPLFWACDRATLTNKMKPSKHHIKVLFIEHLLGCFEILGENWPMCDVIGNPRAWGCQSSF